jgi:CBS domain-containing protein
MPAPEVDMLRVHDLMTTDVMTMSPDLPLRRAIELFTVQHVSGAPVAVGDRVVGVLSTSDILSFESLTPGVTERAELELEDWERPAEWQEGEEPPAAFFSEQWADAVADVLERFASPASLEGDPLAEHTVGEAMTRAVCSIVSSADVYAAADYMVRAGVHRLLVMDGDRLAGILSSIDIVRAVALHRLVTAAPERLPDPRLPADARR